MQRRRVHSRVGRRWRVVQLFVRFLTHLQMQLRLRYVRDIYDEFETSLLRRGRTWRQAISDDFHIAMREDGYRDFNIQDLYFYMTATRLRLALQRFAEGLRRLVLNARRRVRRRLE